MLRGDRAGAADRSALTAFTRGSGAYPLQGAGHCNLYQLFVERALTLARDGGRLGLVLPSGFATDQGSSALRRHVLERTSLDSFVTLENRDGIFPIHRSLKFLLLTLTRAGTTTALPARTGVRSPDALDALPDLGPDPSAVDLPRTLLERIAGPDLAVPDIRSAEDLGIVGRIVFEVPALGDPAGWNVRFGRELNATEDSHHFVAGGGGIPVIEGKLLRPFRVDVGAARSAIPQRVLSRLLDGPRTYQHPRLGYRDVAAPTNQLTLIAAIIPAGCVTTHTVFCLKDRLDEASQLFLCGMLNSFVANYLVRMRVGTHVTAGIVGHLRVPKPDGESPAFLEVVSLGRRLMRGFDRGDAARLQALAAWLYGLTDAAFERVLDTFPLVPTAERAAALAAFRYIVR
jgi:hypothetical protein